MSKILPRLLGLSCFVTLLAAGTASAADLDQAVQNSFKVTLASKANMTIQGMMQKLDADTDLIYTWTRSGRERTLSFDFIKVKVEMDGKPLMNTSMSREKFTNAAQDKVEEITLDKAPDALKTMLQDSFGVPLCKLQVDATGKVNERTVVAGPGAEKDLVGNGMIANAILFHPPYSKSQDEWQADAEISMGDGGYAKGKLTYKKMAGGIVKVTGALVNDSYKQPSTQLTLKQARYNVSGEQTYDSMQQEWATGKLAIDMSFDMVVDEKAIGSAKGTMTIGFEKLPNKD